MITITDNAKLKINRIACKLQISNISLRIKARSGGCSGIEILSDIIDEPEPSDRVFEFDSIKIVIDRKSYLFLIGLEIDYKDTLQKNGLIFNFKDAKKCSCGSSFCI